MKRIWGLGAVLALVIAGSVWALWPRQQQGLVLYCAVDYGPAVAKAFTRATGIPVTTIRLSTGALLARVSAEGKRPAWTLLWFDGNDAAAALDQAGLLARNSVPTLRWNAQGSSLVPKDGSYTPTGLTLAGAFTYRPETLSNPPRSWPGLMRPDLQGAVGMNNPAISGPMYPLLAGLLSEGGGWPKGQGRVMALKDHGLHVYPKNDNTLAALRAGDIKVAVTQSSAAWYLAAQHPELRVVLPKPAFALPSVLTVAAAAPAPVKAEAERFIQFAMSPEIQRLRMAKGGADGYFWPLTTDAPPPVAGLPPLASVSLKALDPFHWGALESQVNQWFSHAVVGQ
ncbi:ABC transporter substrate-binding protein [Mangrovitalea sediminis]|uniref:ABC transporter substrate-binding protein n=1 Tax=Mangrovitalea sediminis TaxID=1982043 RepID=UPI000BE4C570|nr:extracellular solute-binding protein [Mangrovitalea sediminis]